MKRASLWLGVISILALSPLADVLPAAAADAPGTLVDLLADPVRDQFYVLRQDKNEVLVYDGSDLSLLATLRTATTPTFAAAPAGEDIFTGPTERP